MPTDDITEKPVKAWRLVGLRFLKVFSILLLFALGFVGLSYILGRSAVGLSISVTTLFVLPFGLGGLGALLLNPAGEKPGTTPMVCAGMAILVLVAGGLVMREGIICILMLAPLWLLGAFLGAKTVEKAHRKFFEKHQLGQTFDCSIFIALPILCLMFDAGFGETTRTYTVTRSIELSAEADKIWPQLLALEDISSAEGKRNVSQDLLRIPRPRAAIVQGSGVGAVRRAQWGEFITFEEHITEWNPGVNIGWTFAFPNDSVQTYTDRHIAPDGHHLKILRGRYDISALGGGKTRLSLSTDYEATTPVNLYCALWGELILGDIQSNILAIIEDRV